MLLNLDMFGTLLVTFRGKSRLRQQTMPKSVVMRFTPEALAKVAKALTGYAADIDRVAEEMKQAGVESLLVSGVGELMRAEDRFAVFVDNARTSLRRATRAEMFGESQPDSPSPAKKPRPKKARRG